MSSQVTCPITEPLYPLLSCVRLRIGLDGAGITTLAAGAGCTLNCRWCINKKLLKEAVPRFVTAQELYTILKIDDLYFQATGGGVTFGGGEPMLHAEFIHRFKNEIPSAWKLNIETSLAISAEKLSIVLDDVDLFIVDCKDMNIEIYQRYTGGNGKLMKDNLLLLYEKAGPEKVLVRVPLIPGYNTEDDRGKSIESLKRIGFTRFDMFNYVIKDQEES